MNANSKAPRPTPVQRLSRSSAPDSDALTAEVAAWAGRLSELGALNFLLCDGERLFAHCSTHLAYIERRAPFAKARLVDADVHGFSYGQLDQALAWAGRRVRPSLEVN